ncbi:hypothetical protein [Sandaracinus amylolyticus]|uniref:hypothetical protein n=1 Tax=Sandaracinus amylolyticus TaxID=927083 RepID=UPI0012EE437C|nr:hypothetical protein [Sandaracinus amylolyticus]
MVRWSGAAGVLVLAGSLAISLGAPARLAAQAAIDPPVAEGYDTTRGLAMGLGARASAASTSALQYNAAGLTIGRVYHIESVAGYEPGTTRFSVGAAVVDSYSSPIAMGMSYRYIHGNGEYGHGGMEGRLSLALPIGDAFAIGVSGRYMSYWREGQPEGDTRGPFAEGVTVDAAIRVMPIEGLHIAALGFNLIDHGTSLVPRLVGGSASYTIDRMVTIAFDGLADLSTFYNVDGSLRPEAAFGGAVEVFISGVPIRAGYSFDTGRDIHYVTAGLGYVTQDWGLDFSWRQQVVGDDDTWLLLGFRYFVH